MATATVIGTGLIGTSVALALTAQGVTVHLTDRDPAQAAAAQALGAGRTEPAAGPVDLAVIAVPPDHVAPVLADCQRLDVARSYTDVASVKSGPWQAVTDAGLDTGRYLGGHPMAGRERSGPYAARADLFEGRPWVLTPRPDTHPATLAAVRELIALCGAVPVEMTPGNHDRAVALVSHAPHVIAAMTAARLEHADPGALALTGQGLRDTTRVAGGDPALWREILAANAPRVADVLQDVAADLGEMIAALRARDPDRVHGLLAHGHAGHARIPGKHGGTPAPYDVIRVHVGDRPGELARLLAAAHATGINIEDLTIDHTATAAGVAELQVAAPSTARLLRTLTAYGWRYS
ncbi:prephenate dehydrogenase [Streptomyces smaragdinus]|uniref:prephenate dehydrogenase n=1 Tax=Streptomyces smaragdinus TaxID=2585196 RepID=UPI00389AD5B1